MHNSPWTGLPCTRTDPHDAAAPSGHVSQATAFSQHEEEKQNE